MVPDPPLSVYQDRWRHHRRALAGRVEDNPDHLACRPGFCPPHRFTDRRPATLPFVCRSGPCGILPGDQPQPPLLIQIFFIYFVLGPALGLERLPAAILALSLFEGAYTSEILRAGIQSVARGQIEAAHSLGLTTFATYRHIILPQALRTVLPPLTSQAISLVKDSALVSTIAIYDLTMQAQAIIAESYLTFEIWFTVAAMYFVIAFLLSMLVGILEKRLNLP